MTRPLPEFNPLTASATILRPIRRLAPKYDTWQDEVWDYYDRLGELFDGVDWLAKTISRVRLVAAEVVPGGDEPEVIEKGPAAEAIERLAGGTAGQAQLLKEATVHLSVPGEGWLVGERGIDEDRIRAEGLTSAEQWSMRSAEEIRPSVRGKQFEVRDEETDWRPINADSIVLRIWQPHPRRGWEADSSARHARGAMLKLDLINKRIIATILSRLAGNGLLLYDQQRLSLPVNTGPTGDAEGNPDPFAQMLVEAASRGIRDPTSAEAVIPIPIGVDVGDATENVDPELILRHVGFANVLDERLMEQRESAIRELARTLDMPADVMLGLGDVNHWSAWQIEESGIKIHVSPKAETICHALTKGYMVPTLVAADENLYGPQGGRIIVWYDTSEITQRPDRSDNIRDAYDRMEVNGTAYRREIGADDDDKPSEAELIEMVRKHAARQPVNQMAILAELEGKPAPEPATEARTPHQPPEEDQLDQGPPDTQGEPPPPPEEELPKAASARRSVLVPAGVPVENRATKRRRRSNGSNGDGPRAPKESAKFVPNHMP